MNKIIISRKKIFQYKHLIFLCGNFISNSELCCIVRDVGREGAREVVEDVGLEGAREEDVG